MKMRISNGKLASNEKENLKVWEDHLTKVYNNDRPRYALAVELTKEQEPSTELDRNISWKDFTRAFGKIKCDKASGVTEVPANVFKCLLTVIISDKYTNTLSISGKDKRLMRMACRYRSLCAKKR